MTSNVCLQKKHILFFKFLNNNDNFSPTEKEVRKLNTRMIQLIYLLIQTFFFFFKLFPFFQYLWISQSVFQFHFPYFHNPYPLIILYFCQFRFGIQTHAIRRLHRQLSHLVQNDWWQLPQLDHADKTIFRS